MSLKKGNTYSMQVESHNGSGHSYSVDHDIIRQEVNDILDMKDNIFLSDYIPQDKTQSSCNILV